MSIHPETGDGKTEFYTPINGRLTGDSISQKLEDVEHHKVRIFLESGEVIEVENSFYADVGGNYVLVIQERGSKEVRIFISYIYI